MRKQNAVRLTVVAAGLLVAGRALAGSLDPTNAPGPTMHTLEEIYQKVQYLVPQTLSDTTTLLNAGCYAATNLTQVDADLTAANIKTNVTIFGIVGTLSTNTGSAYPAMVPKTGQTTLHQTGDDGNYQTGVAWPNPRFTIQADPNFVLDNLTGLIWTRSATMFGAMSWNSAVAYCESLNYGGQTDWRLPSLRELQSLIDYGRYNYALPAGHPFSSVANTYYWSGTTSAGNAGYAWYVNMADGMVYFGGKGSGYYVWAVRGGQ